MVDDIKQILADAVKAESDPEDYNYPLKCQPSDPMCRSGTGRIDRLCLLRVLRRDEELRLCSEVQALYDSVSWLPGHIEAEIQRHALVENGLCRCWLPEYWRTAELYPKDDKEIWNATVYLRYYERTIDVPPVRLPGQPVDTSQIPLVDLETSKMMSLQSYAHGKPLVVVAGSQS